MLIIRLDAMHPAGDGVFCEFFAQELYARVRADGLRTCGWEVDIYGEDLGPLSDGQRCFLMQNAWPLLHTGALLDWYPQAPAADVNGDDVFVPPGGPSCPE